VILLVDRGVPPLAKELLEYFYVFGNGMNAKDLGQEPGSPMAQNSKESASEHQPRRRIPSHESNP
jgi:hypothetical protein